jgi:hypothetical protein
MPQDIALAVPNLSLNLNVLSVRMWLYRSWDDQSAEVPIAQCCYIRMESFSLAAQLGTKLLDGFLDSGNVPVLTYWNVSTLNELLDKAFS